MIPFLKKNKRKKQIEEANQLLHFAHKIYNYRKDLLSDQQLDELLNCAKEVESLISHKSFDSESLKAQLKSLKAIMKKTGGSIYPLSFWAENTEVFLVASILAIGIRTFFLQPFSIPTNSMYPTYNGMTSYVYSPNEKPQGLFSKVTKTLLLGASHYEINSPNKGEIKVPLLTPIDRFYGMGYLKFKQKMGFKWFIFRTPLREYTFYVGNEAVKFTTPWDFSIDEVFLKTFFPQIKSFKDLLENNVNQNMLEFSSQELLLTTNKSIEKKENILRFDLLTGDKLFVDRFTYNFIKPKIGQAIIFRSDKIEALRHPDGSPEEKYFIKRLVGLPGDLLEVKEPVLYRNGRPIEGAPAFELNATQIGEYRGYTAVNRLSSTKKETILPNTFYGMGDNSHISGDSRMFGFIPKKAVIGKAFFIFYPFGKRWGLAK